MPCFKGFPNKAAQPRIVTCQGLLRLQEELDNHKAATPAVAAVQQPHDDAQRQDLLQKLQEAEDSAAAVAAERDHAKQQLSRCVLV